jgi:hypothetical protein
MSNDVGVSTGLSYDVNPNISLSGRMGMSMTGSIDQSIDVSYEISQTRKIGLKFEREYKELGETLNHSLIAVEYQHTNYAFKMPIYCYNQAGNTSGLVMTSALFCLLNGLALYT